MGACHSLGSAPVFASLAPPPHERFTNEQIHMIDMYLPDFQIYDESSETHRQIAAKFWDKVFKEKRGSRTGSSQSYGTKVRSMGRTTPAATSKISDLFDAFYSYLDQHSPELKPIFRSSLHVKGKVLVHISAGMRSILASEKVADKMMALTKTHVRFGVQLEHFNPLGKALLHAMAAVSGSAWTPEVEDAWRRLFTHCSALLMVTQSKLKKTKTIM